MEIIRCEECGIEYYSETIVKGKSFRHVYPDIVRLETELTNKDKLLMKTNHVHIENQRLQKDLNGELETNQRLTDELAEARAEIERLKAPTTTENLDERLKAAGMLTVTELLAGTPLDRFCAHVGVTTLKSFEEWLLMRRSEILEMQATMLLEKKESDGLYEWIIAHSGALAEVITNFRQAKPEIERKDALIEQMFEALNWYKEQVSNCNREGDIGETARDRLAKDVGKRAKAALSAERGER